MRHLFIVSVLPTVNGLQHARSLEKQQEYPSRKQRYKLQWMETATKHILATLKKTFQRKPNSPLYLE